MHLSQQTEYVREITMNAESNNGKTRHDQVAGHLIKSSDKEIIMDKYSTTSSTVQLSGSPPPLPSEVNLPEDLGVDACPWLDEYIKFSRKWSPESFDGYHEACGLFVLSAIAARRVVFNLGSVRATNLNILLVGRTSIHAKTTAAEIGISLLRAADLDWMLAPDEVTPEKLVEIMSSNELPQNFNILDEHEKERSKKRVLTAGQRAWFLDEFGGNLVSMIRPDSVMFGNKGLIRILDSAPPNYVRSTVGRGQNSVRNPYLALLGNITIADLVPVARKCTTLWGDGFFARFAMVVPPADELNSGEFPNQEKSFPASLIDPLAKWDCQLGFPEYQVVESGDKQILKIKPINSTPLIISDKAYKAFYNYHNGLRNMILNSQNHDLDGNYGRLGEKALRIAALFASLENNDSIELNHWAKAQAIAERWRVGLHELYRQVNDINRDQLTTYIKNLPIEDQVLRAVRKNKLMDMREISQFTGLKKDIVEPALAKLVSENLLAEIKDNGKKRFMLLE